MANTTNLNLEKPIGTDQALVSVINSNMDKIDTFAGSTNQALSKVNTVKSITASMTTNDFAEGLNAISWGYDQTIDGVTSANSMRGYLVKATNAMYGVVANAQGTVVYYIGYSQNAWHVTQGALTGDWTGASAYKEQIEASAGSALQMFGKVRTLSFQGVSREHTENEVLMTLPSEHRPIGGNNIFTVGTVGTTPVIIRLNGSNGQIALYVANNAGTGRIYFNMSWIVA